MRALVLALGGASALALASPPSPPALNTITGADLAQFCGGSDHVSQNVCRVYILGVTQGVVLGQGNAAPGRTRVCVPPDIDAERLEEAVKARLAGLMQAGDAAAHEDASRLIARALTGLYPCGAPPRP
ncbi:MAG: hypothetical protein JSS29_01400 [Proteobacteria bacterium]|nr:hypothetical protein [Pseudomonadota bacterium]